MVIVAYSLFRFIEVIELSELSVRVIIFLLIVVMELLLLCAYSASCLSILLWFIFFIEIGNLSSKVVILRGLVILFFFVNVYVCSNVC